MTRTALILGINGNFGASIATELHSSGWKIRALMRDTSKSACVPAQITNGDASRPADVLGAAQGVDVIVHAVNPPGYQNWNRLAVPMLEASIAAAQASGARILLPGNLYNYAAVENAALAEGAPQRPATEKGQIRVRMEQMLEQAARRSGVKSLVLRAGDFFGGSGTSSWLNNGLLREAPKAILYPGRAQAGHSWAYLPDLAAVAVRLLDVEDRLATFEAVNFKGHYLEEGIVMAEILQDLLGNPPIKPFPWLILKLASPFNETFRGLIEMRYLWEVGIGLSNTKLQGLIGDEPHTPLPVALARSVARAGHYPPTAHPANVIINAALWGGVATA